MKCPYCGDENTKVVDSRPVDDDTAIRRRRLCEACGKRFTSYEKAEVIPLRVIKKDNSREDFDRNKIEAGIARSCHKLSVSSDQIIAIVDAVERDIYNKDVREIETTEIGEMVISYLKDLDPVAYVRFASVYREFKDVDTFLKEIKEIMKTRKFS